MSEVRKPRRALLSVYDKTGLVEFARALHDEFGTELISTGGTAKVLKDAGLPVTLVEEVTGFPEMMDGRVKTLHPKIHAAILADRDNPEHMRQLKEQGIEPIDMVVVNLYPFEQTIARPHCTFAEAIEMIDIGGPCLLRAAAKNHKHVWVLSDSAEWPDAVGQLRRKDLDESTWRWIRLVDARSAFERTRQYDRVVENYLACCAELPVFARTLEMCSRGKLRYGENPHQEGDLLRVAGLLQRLVPICRSQVEVSFNNYTDATAAYELCAELTRAATSLAPGTSPTVGDRPPVGHLTGQRPVPPTGGPTSGRSTPGQSMRKATTDEHFSRRHLPHIERPEAVYYLTFRTRSGPLSPAERDLVLQACRFWHGRKLTLHCVSVMPDHVHILLTPYEPAADRWVPLGELLKSVKSYSSSQINKLRGQRGSIWMDENFDRLIRNQADFAEKWDYIYHNPVTANLVPRPEEYGWFWHSGLGWGELAVDASDRPDVGCPEDGAALQSADRPEVGPPSAVRVLKSCCFIKHTNACGVATDADPVEAYRRAYLGDPNAAMGGILAVNFPVTPAFAEVVLETYARFGKPLKDAGAPYAPGGFFVEVWLAPSFDDEAVRIIRGEVEGKPKKDWGQRVRLLAVGDLDVEPDPNELDYKRITGGMLVQTRDLIGLNEDQWQVVTQRKPDDTQMEDLRLAWLVCKHTKSNAITICRDGTLLGNGAGQMSRVMSCRIATWLARENGHADQLQGAVAASDAFFPFRDGPDILIDAGVTALIQPGGSKRDADVIAACNERGVAMIFTGTRHFKH